MASASPGRGLCETWGLPSSCNSSPRKELKQETRTGQYFCQRVEEKGYRNGLFTLNTFAFFLLTYLRCPFPFTSAPIAPGRCCQHYSGLSLESVSHSRSGYVRMNPPFSLGHILYARSLLKAYSLARTACEQTLRRCFPSALGRFPGMLDIEESFHRPVSDSGFH
jgi:hypothetical protein